VPAIFVDVGAGHWQYASHQPGALALSESEQLDLEIGAAAESMLGWSAAPHPRDNSAWVVNGPATVIFSGGALYESGAEARVVAAAPAMARALRRVLPILVQERDCLADSIDPDCEAWRRDFTALADSVDQVRGVLLLIEAPDER